MPWSLRRPKKKGSKLSLGEGTEEGENNSNPPTAENGHPPAEQLTEEPASQSDPPSNEMREEVPKEDNNLLSPAEQSSEPQTEQPVSDEPPKNEEESKSAENQPKETSSDKPSDSQLEQSAIEPSNPATSKTESGEATVQFVPPPTPQSSDSFVSDDRSSPVVSDSMPPPVAIQMDDLLCVICKAVLSEPKILPCLHSVCKKCERAASTNRGSSVLYQARANADEDTLHCPKCSEDHVLPDGGFPTNIYLQCKLAKREIHEKLGSLKVFECTACEKKNAASHYCSDCKDFLCSECDSFHRSFKATRNHVISNLGEENIEDSIERSAKDLQTKLQCPQHVVAVSMYCEQCDMCICSVCLTESHTAHSTAVIDDTLASRQKDDLRRMISENNEEIVNLQPEGREKDHLAETIHSELKATQQSITRLVELLQSALVARREALNSEAMDIANRKLNPVRKQREVISKIIELYQSVQPVVFAVVGDGSPDDIALTMSMLARRQKKLRMDLEENLKPMAESTNIILRTSGSIDKVSSALGEIGYVCGGSHPANSRIHLTYKVSPSISLVQGDKLVCEAIMKDFRGQVYPRGGEKVTANLLRLSEEGHESVFDADVTDNDDGTYIVTFNSYAPGKNILTVQCYGEDLSNSPMELSLIVKDINLIGDKATVIPCPDNEGIYRTVAVGEDNVLLVTDCEKRRLCVLEEDGTLKISFGSKGTRDGTFKHKMTGALFNSEGNLYVTDDDNGRIQQFRVEDGQVLNVIGEAGTRPGRLDRPRGIAIHPADKKVYISEFDSHRISVFLPNGQHRYCFGKKGTGLGKLKHPLGIAFGPDGNLYVVDSGNNRIQVFSPEGDALRSFSNKYATVDLNQPWGIAVTDEGYVLVTERSGNCVSVFHRDGTFIRHFGSKGAAPGCFDQPCGIAINGNGQVFVMDSNNKRVQIFTYVHK